MTCRHFHLTPALKEAINEKLNKILNNHFLRITAANCVLSIDGSEHKTQITLFGNHMSFFSEGISHDMYQSIEMASKKIESQIRKLKNKIKRPCHYDNGYITLKQNKEAL